MDQDEALELLGLSLGATEAEVKNALVRKQLAYHPDRSAGASPAVVDLATEQVKKVNAAADALLSGNFETQQPQSGSSSSQPTGSNELTTLVLIRTAARSKMWDAVIILGEGFLRATISQPYKTEVREILTEAYLETGQLAMAAKHGEASVHHNKKDAVSWCFLAAIYWQQQQWRSARKALENALTNLQHADLDYSQRRLLREKLSSDRDDVDAMIIEGMTLSRRADLSIAGKCPICRSEAGFANGRCKNCKYRSNLRTVAKAAAESVFKKISDSLWDEDQQTSKDSNYCPRCRSGTSYRSGHCGACNYTNPTGISNDNVHPRFQNDQPEGVIVMEDKSLGGCTSLLILTSMVLISVIAVSMCSGSDETNSANANAPSNSISRQIQYDKSADSSSQNGGPASDSNSRRGRPDQGAEDRYQRGINHIRRRRIPDGLRLLRLAAEQDHIRAMIALGSLANEGVGRQSPSYLHAFHWWHQAAALGDSYAMALLGTLCETGRGTEKQIDTAVALYLKSAHAGHKVGQYQLGLCYDCGIGVEADVDIAASWMYWAAQQGLIEATNWSQNHSEAYYGAESWSKLHKSHYDSRLSGLERLKKYQHGSIVHYQVQNGQVDLSLGTIQNSSDEEFLTVIRQDDEKWTHVLTVKLNLHSTDIVKANTIIVAGPTGRPKKGDFVLRPLDAQRLLQGR